MDPRNTLSHDWYQRVWNEGQENAIDELFAPDAIAHGLAGDAPMLGPGNFKSFYRAFRDTFGDIHVDVKRVVSQDDHQASLCAVTAKHVRSGQDVSFEGMTLARIDNGKIVEAWNFFDFLKMHQQLGNELQVVNY